MDIYCDLPRMHYYTPDGKRLKGRGLHPKNCIRVYGITWRPLKPKLVPDYTDAPLLNIWEPPPPLTPVSGGSTDGWLRYIRSNYREAAHILKWMAHLAQQPDKKICHALVLPGLDVEALRPLIVALGEHNVGYPEVRDIIGRWNRKYITNSLNVVSGAHKRVQPKLWNELDWNPELIAVNGSREYVANLSHYIFTSTDTDKFELKRNDRRFFVATPLLARPPLEPLGDADVYACAKYLLNLSYPNAWGYWPPNVTVGKVQAAAPFLRIVK